ncbi:MAG: transposase [Aggregatilineales bacterium]
MDSTTQFIRVLRELGLNLEATFMPEALRVMTETLMDIDVSRMIDATHYERNDTRVAYRNGYRQRTWKTPAGKIRLNVPKLRSGTYAPDFIDEKLTHSLLEMIRKAVVFGVNGRQIDDYLARIDMEKLSVSEIAQLQETLDDLVAMIHEAPIHSTFPYIWLETIPLINMLNERETSYVAAVALGVDEQGEAQLLGFEVGRSAHDVFFWRLFLQNLVERGLEDVRLVISDDFRGVKAAVQDILDADWHYHRAYALQRVLDDVPAGDHQEVIAAIATVFLQSDPMGATARLNEVVRSLQRRFPSAMATLYGLSGDLLETANHPAYGMASAQTLLRVKQALSHETDAIAVMLDDLLDDSLAVDAFSIGGGDFRHESQFMVYGEHRGIVVGV